jgi:hypothetical protein
VSKRKGSTDKAELVETHNLSLALKRLQDGGGGYDDGRWRRALYHAVGMTCSRNAAEKIRSALELP